MDYSVFRYGIQPGPSLFENESALVWGLIGNLMLLTIFTSLVGA